MIKKIFVGYGCEIVEKGSFLFICYDSGESAGSKMVEHQISTDEATKAKKSERAAYEVILAAQNRGRSRLG